MSSFRRLWLHSTTIAAAALLLPGVNGADVRVARTDERPRCPAFHLAAAFALAAHEPAPGATAYGRSSLWSFQGCSNPTPATGTGWPAGAVVQYSFDGLDADQQEAAEWAMGQWETFAANKGIDVTFKVLLKRL